MYIDLSTKVSLCKWQISSMIKSIVIESHYICKVLCYVWHKNKARAEEEEKEFVALHQTT